MWPVPERGLGIWARVAAQCRGSLTRLVNGDLGRSPAHRREWFQICSSFFTSRHGGAREKMDLDSLPEDGWSICEHSRALAAI
jgi:hypothetical protein